MLFYIVLYYIVLWYCFGAAPLLCSPNSSLCSLTCHLPTMIIFFSADTLSSQSHRYLAKTRLFKHLTFSICWTIHTHTHTHTLKGLNMRIQWGFSIWCRHSRSRTISCAAVLGPESNWSHFPRAAPELKSILVRRRILNMYVRLGPPWVPLKPTHSSGEWATCKNLHKDTVVSFAQRNIHTHRKTHQTNRAWI